MAMNAQISNQLPFGMEILYMTPNKQIKPFVIMEPRDVVSLPNTLVITPPQKLFFRPLLTG